MNFPILSTIIFLPLLGSIFIFLFNDPKKNNGAIYVSLFTSLSNFLLNKWYIDELYTVVLVNPLKRLGLVLWKKGDQNTIDRFGPDGISKIIKQISNKAVQFQTGYIYDYAFVMLIGLSALITYLILK